MSGYDEIGAMSFADGYIAAGGTRDKELCALLMEEFKLDKKTAKWHIAEAWKRSTEKIEKQMQAQKYAMREPKVENKYDLTLSQIKKFRVADRSKIKEKPFWRNEQICAWYLSGHASTRKDEEFGTDDEYWMGFYDEDAPNYAGEFRFDFSTYGGMCGYHFENFFVPESIKCENDLKIQELFLKRINWLLDEGILKKT